MNQLDKQYQELLFDIIENGVDKDTRNGKTRSVFGKQIRHKMKEGFPLLTTKKMYWKGIVTELLWFLRGDTNIKFLVDNGCNIWTGDAYKKYLDQFTGYEDVPNQEEFIQFIKTDFKFAERWGGLGPVYGKQWRSWKFTDKFTNGEQIAYVNGKIDQIQNLINDLKTNPDSRRLMVTAWNVGELDSMTLPPCHYGFQVYTRELTWDERHELAETKYQIDDVDDVLDKEGIPTRAISLMWNQRSVDTFIGLPFNIASYGLLLEILAKMTNMVPDELIGNLGDTHLYKDHLPQAREQLVKEPYVLPKLKIDDQYWVDNCGLDTYILSMLIEDFQIENYQSHPSIKAPLIN
jgi:thymidylate synthase